MVNRGEIEEIKEFLSLTKHKKDSEEVSIIFDGKQFSVRIPRRFADAAEINTKNDIFVFDLKLPPPGSKEEPVLTGRLVRRER